jgi:ankyrin repeat protein
MLEAVQTGNLKMVESLLVHDCAAIIDAPILVGGSTSLFIAAQIGHLEIVKLLINMVHQLIKRRERRREERGEEGKRKGDQGRRGKR